MFSRALKIVFISILMSSSVYASGGGEASAEGAEKTTKEIRSNEDPYQTVQSRVQATEAKIQSAQQEIKKLIEEKQNTKDPVKVNEIIRQMLTLHRQLSEDLKEYDQQRALLKYRYPEKAGAERRVYERIELKSLEDMETEMSLTSSLNRTLRKVRTQFGGFPERLPAQDESGVKPLPKKAEPGLVDAVILKK